MSKKRLLILFGGNSSEYEVSLESAASVIENLSSDEFEIFKIGITRDGQWLSYDGTAEDIRRDRWQADPDCVPAFLSPSREQRGVIRLLPSGGWETVPIDAAFPVLHGRNGEDGTVQGLFALAGIPFVGCDMLSSAICMDKAVTNMLLDHCGIPHTDWALITRERLGVFAELADEWEVKLGYPMFVKPANAGSSVGISKAHDRAELRAALELAFEHDRKVVVERAIVGRELECAVLGNGSPIASKVSEIIPRNEFYDYEAKYISASETVCPAEIPEQLSERIRALALDAYKSLGCGGLARVDFLWERATDRLFLNELNTIPGFTAISMYPQMMAASGISFPSLISKLIDLAVARSEGRDE